MKIPKHGQVRLKTGWLQAITFLSQDFPFDIYLSRDFNIYARMTAASPACPYKVMPQFLPEWPGEGFWLEARDIDGSMEEAPAYAIGGRPFHGDLAGIIDSWPGKWILPSLNLSGRWFFNGGQWIAEHRRKQGLSPLTCKLLHAMALLLYDFDHIFALVVPEMHGGGNTIKEGSLSWRQGFRSCIPGIKWTDYYSEDQHLSLISMTRRQAIQSLSAPPSAA